MTEHIVDSNVFIHGSSRKIPFENLVTVPEVTMELESVEARNRFENEEVNIQEPSKDEIKRMEEKSGKTGSQVSDTDIRLLALAKERNGVLVTDDYHMQNLAERLGISWKPFLKEGIQKDFKWEKVCSNCGKKTEKQKCPVCGAETIRKSL